ncbi:MAG: MerR family transcriptional regulator [Blautia wexlerae]
MILPLQAIVGFFPNPERKGNIHYFSDNELEVLRIIECLKKSGLGIKDIKQFLSGYLKATPAMKKKRII